MASLSAIKRKQQLHTLRRRRIRAVVHGTAGQPRLSVFRSGKHVYAQLIDDVVGKTLCASSDMGLVADADGDGGRKQQLAHIVGKKLAEKAKSIGISTVTFDRGGCAYHGRVKAVADGAREGGLVF